MKQIKVTVVLPCYNVEQCVSRALDSLINQTLKNIEIICVDDKSTDGTLYILKSYAKKDKRIKIIALSKNLGVSVARNVGLGKSKGEWVSFIDPDDYVDLDFFEVLIDACHEYNVVKAGVVYHDILTGEETKSSLNTDIQKNKLFFNYQHWSGLYKTAFLKKNNIFYPEDVRTGQDIVFLLNVVLHTDNIIVTNNTCYHYNDNRPGGLDSKNLSNDKVLSRISMLNHNVDLLKQNVLSKEDKNLCVTQYIIFHWNLLMKKCSKMIDKKLCFEWLVSKKDFIGKKVLKSVFDYHQIKSIYRNDFCSFMMKPEEYTFVYKKREGLHRTIYLFGNKLFSYYKKQTN